MSSISPDGSYVPLTKVSNQAGLWYFIMGIVSGVFITFTVTILSGWIIDTLPHSSWWNKAFYGYMVGCTK
jgi:hypothetical protein